MKTLSLFDDPPTSSGFAEFWSEYPGFRKINKAACAKKWTMRRLDLKAKEIVAYVKAMKRSDQWKRGIVPAPEVFINQSRWEADLPPDVAQQVQTSDDRIKAEKEAAEKEQARLQAYIARTTGIRRVA